jgi:hypothetical protein
LFALACLPVTVLAQANYEIQVYGADTVPANNLMVELHSNYTLDGQTTSADGVYPTNHQEHEKASVFPLKLAIGAVDSTDAWTWEIRPIIDKAIGRWYFATNPALQRTLHGPDVNQGLGFAPSAKVSYDFSRVVSAGIEYYADYGRLDHFAAARDQQRQIFVVTDLNVSPLWEINIGIGMGTSAATDRLIVKAILGRRSTGAVTRPPTKEREAPKSALLSESKHLPSYEMIE